MFGVSLVFVNIYLKNNFMKISKKILLSVLTISVLILSACTSNTDATNSKSENFKVVTTIAPLYSFTANLIEGTSTELVNLIPAQSSAHNFQLTSNIAKSIEEADLIVINGLGLEEFLTDSFSQFPDKVVDTSDGVGAIAPEEMLNEEDEDEHAGEYDPHIWLDPTNAIKQVDNITNALVAKDPANEAIYKQNGDELKKRIVELNVELKAELETVTPQPFIVFHDAYQYFGRAFNLKAEAAFEPFPGKAPSVVYLRQLLDIISAKKVKIVYAEPQFSPKLLESVARDNNLTIGELDPMGQTLEKDGYFVTMRKNVAELKRTFEIAKEAETLYQ